MNQLKVYAIDGIVPVVDPTAYVHPSAVLIGDVIVGPDCYVGPCASLRGDFGRLILERSSNLQDTCVMHGFPGTDTVTEEDGHVEMPPRMLIADMPAKAIRARSDEEIRWKSSGTTTCQDLTRRSLATMEATVPLSAIEPGRKRIQMPDVVPLVELRRREG